MVVGLADLRSSLNLGCDSELQHLGPGEFTIWLRTAQIHRYQSSSHSVFWTKCHRGVNRVHWDSGEGVDGIVARALMEEFMSLYLIWFYGDFGETLGNSHLKHLKGALLNSWVTSQVWKKQSRMQRTTGTRRRMWKLYSSVLVLSYVWLSFTLFSPFFLEVNSEQYIHLKSRIILATILYK